MEFIGFMLLISLIGIFVGVVGIILTCALSIWHKIALISLVVFIYSIFMLWITSHKEENDG